MIVRMRTHSNFVEYVPLMLVLLGLLELGGANRSAIRFATLTWCLTPKLLWLSVRA
jgi:uncharacterized membrane protein YecN with MAPEG domain